MDNKKIKYLTISVFILAIVNIGLVTMIYLGSQRKTRERHPMSERVREHQGGKFLMRELDASPKQQLELKALFQDHRKRKDSIETLIRIKKSQLAKMAISGEENLQVKDSTLIEISRLALIQENEMYDHFSQMKAICNEEQIEKLYGILSRANRSRPQER